MMTVFGVCMCDLVCVCVCVYVLQVWFVMPVYLGSVCAIFVCVCVCVCVTSMVCDDCIWCLYV